MVWPVIEKMAPRLGFWGQPWQLSARWQQLQTQVTGHRSWGLSTACFSCHWTRGQKWDGQRMEQWETPWQLFKAGKQALVLVRQYSRVSFANVCQFLTNPTHPPTLPPLRCHLHRHGGGHGSPCTRFCEGQVDLLFIPPGSRSDRYAFARRKRCHMTGIKQTLWRVRIMPHVGLPTLVLVQCVNRSCQGLRLHWKLPWGVIENSARVQKILYRLPQLMLCASWTCWRSLGGCSQVGSQRPLESVSALKGNNLLLTSMSCCRVKVKLCDTDWVPDVQLWYLLTALYQSDVHWMLFYPYLRAWCSGRKPIKWTCEKTS